MTEESDRKAREIKVLKDTASTFQQQLDETRQKHDLEISKLRNAKMAAIESKKAIVTLQEIEGECEMLKVENFKLNKQLNNMKEMYLRQNNDSHEQELMVKVIEQASEIEKLRLNEQEVTGKFNTEINQLKRNIITLE